MKILITILALIILVLSACQIQEISADTTITETTISNEEKYEYILDNLDSLLENVYKGYVRFETVMFEDGFTAFSIEYNNEYFLITAGHCLEYYNEEITKLEFENIITGEIIDDAKILYSEYRGSRDFAILKSDKINSGLEVVKKYKKNTQLYTLGFSNGNIKSYKESVIAGESGSPVIDLDMKVNSMVIATYTDRTQNITVPILTVISKINDLN